MSNSDCPAMQNLAGAIVEKAIGKSSIPPIPLISPNESVTVTVVSCAFASLVNVRLWQFGFSDGHCGAQYGPKAFHVP